LAAPWALCEAWRTAMLVVLTAGVDRRKADRAVSMVAMAGDEEPVGSARILGSNMVESEVCVVCAVSLSAVSTFDVRSLLARLSTFCRLRNSCWEHEPMLATTSHSTCTYAFAFSLRIQHVTMRLGEHQETPPLTNLCISRILSTGHHSSHHSTDA